jgi:hypothetical protein
MLLLALTFKKKGDSRLRAASMCAKNRRLTKCNADVYGYGPQDFENPMLCDIAPQLAFDRNCVNVMGQEEPAKTRQLKIKPGVFFRLNGRTFSTIIGTISSSI